MKIGRHHFERPLALAPMAGVSDRPFRMLCRQFGADYAVTEMLASRTELWSSKKTLARIDMHGEAAPHIMQIAGAEPHVMAAAARYACAHGADIVDINMGCPAKKVCHKLAGSALLRDEALVAAILLSVVAAVDVPVTLKMRTGWDPLHRNGTTIARIAEQSGIAAITVHGRTRACAFRGKAEYDTIAAIKHAVSIPVIANGDITDASSARHVLAHTGADGLMLGRAAYGNPWLFREIKAALNGEVWRAPTGANRIAVMREHLVGLHAHYGGQAGSRIARKHIGWYLAHMPAGTTWRSRFCKIDDPVAQLDFLDELACQLPLDLAA